MDQNKKGVEVDAETKLAIAEGNKSVVDQVGQLIRENTKELRQYVDMKTAPTEREAERNRKNIIEIYGRVGALEQRQSIDEGQKTGSHLSEEQTDKKTKTVLTVVGISVTLIVAGIGWLIAVLSKMGTP